MEDLGVFVDNTCIQSRSLVEGAGFVVEKCLESSGCDVFLATMSQGSFQMKVKKVVVKRFRGPTSKCFEATETFLWQDHQNIAKILTSISCGIDTLIVCEYYCGGDLYHHFQEIGVFPEFLARIVMRDLLSGVTRLHQAGICHRDVKPENCVLDGNGMLKIVDFGLATHFDDGHMLTDFCGSLEYVAPEILFRSPYHGPDVDIWACGVVLFEMVVGDTPFVVEQSEFGCCSIVYDFPHALVADAQITGACEKMLKSFLCVDPESRIKMGEALDCAWLIEEHSLTVDDIESIERVSPKSVVLTRLRAILKEQIAHDMSVC